MMLRRMPMARKASATAAFQAQVTALVDQLGSHRHNKTVALFSHGKPATEVVPAPNID
jgi:hypothetical protein